MSESLCAFRSFLSRLLEHWRASSTGKKIVTLILTHIRNEVSSTHYMPTLRIPDLYVKDPAKSTEGAMSKSKW